MYVCIYICMYVLYRHAAAASSVVRTGSSSCAALLAFTSTKVQILTKAFCLFFFLVRPGSVIGMQQHYLVQWEHQLRRCDGALLDPQVV